MTPDERAFIAAIITDPWDDGVRLIFSDWLDEHGREAEAEFIRVQCALARHEAEHGRDQRWHELATRQQSLYFGDGFKERILRTLPSGFRLSLFNGKGKDSNPWVLLRRGFVEKLACSPEVWWQRAEALMRSHPITEVALSGWGGNPRQETMVRRQGTTAAAFRFQVSTAAYSFSELSGMTPSPGDVWQERMEHERWRREREVVGPPPLWQQTAAGRLQHWTETSSTTSAPDR